MTASPQGSRGPSAYRPSVPVQRKEVDDVQRSTGLEYWVPGCPSPVGGCQREVVVVRLAAMAPQARVSENAFEGVRPAAQALRPAPRIAWSPLYWAVNVRLEEEGRQQDSPGLHEGQQTDTTARRTYRDGTPVSSTKARRCSGTLYAIKVGLALSWMSWAARSWGGLEDGDVVLPCPGLCGCRPSRPSPSDR